MLGGAKDRPVIQTGPDTALLVIDVQNDFLPGGALAVPEGDTIIPVINHLMTLPFGCVVASRDWHPADHISFRPSGPWPAHCVAGTHGAEFPDALRTEFFTGIISKATSADQDSYSAFSEKPGSPQDDLCSFLRGRGITRVVLTGLVLDYCVAATAADAVRLGFHSMIVAEACRAISPGEALMTRLRSEGSEIVTQTELDSGP
ncbi:isochorismatase family protein [Acetobacter sp. AN02]|uniref:isochorismatase family protein n=1 Tax=Acetobacter sp. AN02 TaxID=2894186 RepID=UPI0024345378|nr:isochorismatase family protein [Acetobacter sp. AN02]MDG6095285.1 isochorismatase family protein [Acetobacter sp. AN02]